MTDEEFSKITPSVFEKLPHDKRLEAIHHHDEHVRTWRSTCQRCGAHLHGTLATIRKHVCGDDTE